MPPKKKIATQPKGKSLRELILKAKNIQPEPEVEEVDEVVDLQDIPETVEEEKPTKRVAVKQVEVSPPSQPSFNHDELISKIKLLEEKLTSNETEKAKRRAEKAKEREVEKKLMKQLEEDYNRRSTQRQFIGGAYTRNLVDISNAIKF